MSPRLTKRILAIDPGTKFMGVAVFEGTSLLHHTVASIERRQTLHAIMSEARATVRRLITTFRPDVLAFEKTFLGPNRNAVLLNLLSGELLALGKKHRLEVLAVAPSTVKKFMTGNGFATKDTVAKRVLDRYPDLAPYLTPGPKWKRRFHENMFDAVAVGVWAIGRLEVRS
jgi:Holliday junction resolvasome RuvABC endonuclease subunit